MNTSREFRAAARQALSGRWKKWILLFAAAAAFAEGFGLSIPLYVCFSKAVPLTALAGGTLSLSMPQGYDTLSVSVPEGFGWVLAGIIIACMLASCVTVVGRYRACRAALEGGDISLATLFPWKLLGKCLLMNLARAIVVWLWSLLLIVPGFIAVYRYSMADDLLARHPEMGPIEALRESRLRMRGYKMSLFMLDLSFIGWILLAELAGEALSRGFSAIGGGMAAAIVLEVIYNIIMWILLSALLLYRMTARAVFFSAVDGERSEARFETRAESESEAQPEEEEKTAVDEEAAEKMYRAYRCSRSAMRKAGVLEEYEALGAASYREENWRREYGNELMRRFSSDADALDELLTLESEYSMDGLTDRMLERVERHIREESLDAETILNMAGRILAMLNSGAFDADAGFAARKRAQIAGMADRLEERLQREDPNGDWRRTLELIRGMCAAQ